MYRSFAIAVSQLKICDFSGETFNPLNAELNPICNFLALLRAHPILHVSRIRVNTASGIVFSVSDHPICTLDGHIQRINSLNAELNHVCHLLEL